MNFRLMNPGPEISGGSHISVRSRLSTIFAAISRGFDFSSLASGRATLAWKSANWLLLITGSRRAKSSPKA